MEIEVLELPKQFAPPQQQLQLLQPWGTGRSLLNRTASEAS